MWIKIINEFFLLRIKERYRELITINISNLTNSVGSLDNGISNLIYSSLFKGICISIQESLNKTIT